MSYDFWVEADTGGTEPMCAEPFFDDEHPRLGSDGLAGNAVVTGSGYSRCGNYTSNVSSIWRRCLTAGADVAPHGWWVTGHRLHVVDGEWRRADPREDDSICLADLGGKDCETLAPLFAAAVEWGITHLDEIRALNPDNGWGDAAGAVTFLWDIQRMCEAHPKATLGLSY